MTDFSRYTDRARRTIVLAQEECRMLGHPEVGTEHLLLGLIAEGEGVAFRALSRLGVTLEPARARVEDLKGTGKESPKGHVPFMREARLTCERALREALQLGHNYIGTEHLLLALARHECDARQVLVAMGHSGLEVRATVLGLLRGYEQAERDAKAPPPGPCTRCGGTGSEPQSPRTPATLADRLAVITADLEGYVERRAAELAAPAIEEAEQARERAALRVTDLQEEFGRQMRGLERQVARWREVAEGKAADHILRWDEVHPGDRVLDDSVGLCLVTRVSVHDDHLGMSLTDDGGRNWHVTGMPATLTAVRRAVPEVPDGG